MPRKAEWTHRLDDAIAQLRTLGHARIDRAALEELLGLSPRQALRILNRLGAQQAGKSLSMDRLELVGCLEAIRGGEAVRREAARRDRVHEQLQAARRRHTAGRMSVPAPTGPSDFTNLAPGIRLTPGRLEITFQSGEELLGRLYELVQAATDDIDRFLATAATPARE
jgi:hypothetical protein